MTWSNFPECRSDESHSQITVSEKGKTFSLLNSRRVKISRVRVDGCALRGQRACDWMLVPADGQEELYVELKGSDVEYAAEQIRASIVALSSNRRLLPKRCFVISSRCPLVSSEVQVLAIKFKREFNALLVIRRVRHSAPYPRIAL